MCGIKPEERFIRAISPLWYAKGSRDDKVDIGACKAKTPSTLMAELWYPPIALQLKLNRATPLHIMPLLKPVSNVSWEWVKLKINWEKVSANFRDI